MDSTRILLVDDDDATRELLCDFFGDRGYAVETAGDGAKALMRLATFAADLVITDLEMPGMSGLELIRSLHATRHQTPVLLVTARARSGGARKNRRTDDGVARACRDPRGSSESLTTVIPPSATLVRLRS